MSSTKSAFIAIVGRPNVGKSSLMNRMCGQKVSIVTDKPQTTRTRITGILTKGETQLVFLDTPGIHRPRTGLGEHMMKSAGEGLAGADCAVLVAYAAARPSDTERGIIDRIKKEKAVSYLALNKTDLVKDKSLLLERIAEYKDMCSFKEIIPMSVKDGENVDTLLDCLMREAKEGPHFFSGDALTDQPERVMVAETVREKMLILLDKEIPHGTAVCTELFSERADGVLDISAEIYCEKESHKRIIIGKGGAMLKRIGTLARIDMENFFGCRVNLKLWVKVKENWRNREGVIRTLGFD